jgi:hypothetical protein
VPIVRVTLVQPGSGANWATLVIAILGVVLSVGSLGWQAYSFWRSGHRVRVELRAGAVGRGAMVRTSHLKFPGEQVMTALAQQGFRTPVLIAIIRNVGRQAVTVQQCRWKVGAIVLSAPSVGPDNSFPRRLELGDQCEAMIELASITPVLHASAEVLNNQKQAVTVIAELGTGKTIFSQSLKISIAEAESLMPLEVLRRHRAKPYRENELLHPKLS